MRREAGPKASFGGAQARIGRLVVATRNEGKLAEIRRALDGFVDQVVGLHQIPDAPKIVEDGLTFAANASKKGRVVAGLTGEWVLADDSGLEVDALGGEPGVRSARWADAADRERLGLPENADQDQANNAKLLYALRGVVTEARSARFSAALALVAPNGAVTIFEGTCEGWIAEEPRGSGGFGYDPLFVPEGCDSAMAELSLEEKGRISHRGRALALLRRYLEAQPGLQERS